MGKRTPLVVSFVCFCALLSVTMFSGCMPWVRSSKGFGAATYILLLAGGTAVSAVVFAVSLFRNFGFSKAAVVVLLVFLMFIVFYFRILDVVLSAYCQ
ncbi:hypothetical protein [Paraburkholderia ferrariae]|uniref:hypothetical protein n=1 Tax=Paraburkholderia ferrariae TaxID=386056 RepID=UPI00048608AC|nr:hypothetical protein [Paraburkholderia ferrariae]